MTLGEKITSLRTSLNMSQGDLAEKLNVSRQSVSKWETNASTPDLDKLIQLSGLFGITIDELVKGEAVPSPKGSASPQPSIIVQKTVSTQRIIGFILLGFGLLCCLFALILGGLLLVIGIYVLFCSIMCLTVKNHVGLKIGWFTFLIVMVLAPRFTGIRMLGIFFPAFFRDFSVVHIATVILWLLLFLLIFFTIRAYKRGRGDHFE